MDALMPALGELRDCVLSLAYSEPAAHVGMLLFVFLFAAGALRALERFEAIQEEPR